MKGLVKRRFLLGGWQYRLLAVNALHFVLIAAVFALTLRTRIWPLLGLGFALSVLHNIIVSHRIAGPLYRLRREFDAIGDGDLRHPIRVRKSDYLQEEAAAIDRMVARTRSRIMTIKDANKAAGTALLEIEYAAEAGSRERLNNALRAAREDLSGAAAELETFICSDKEAAVARTQESADSVPFPEAAREPEPVS